MNNRTGTEATSQKPAFEPSELVDHGDAGALTRAGGNTFGDGDGTYES